MSIAGSHAPRTQRPANDPQSTARAHYHAGGSLSARLHVQERTSCSLCASERTRADLSPAKRGGDTNQCQPPRRNPRRLRRKPRRPQSPLRNPQPSRRENARSNHKPRRGGFTAPLFPMKCPTCGQYMPTSGDRERPDLRPAGKRLPPFDPKDEVQRIGYDHAVFDEVERDPGTYSKCPYRERAPEWYRYNIGYRARLGI